MKFCDSFKWSNIKEFKPDGFLACSVYPEKPILSLVCKTEVFAHASIKILVARHFIRIEIMNGIMVE